MPKDIEMVSRNPQSTVCALVRSGVLVKLVMIGREVVLIRNSCMCISDDYTHAQL